MPYNPKSLANLRQYRTRVRIPRHPDNTSVLTKRAAMIACAVCSNNKTSLLSNIADQLTGVTPRGVAHGALIGLADLPRVTEEISRIPAGQTRTVRVLGPKGAILGFVMTAAAVLVGAEALNDPLTMLFNKETADVLRSVSDALRKKTRKCCELEVSKRLLRQNSAIVSTPHKTNRRRWRKPGLT